MVCGFGGKADGYQVRNLEKERRLCQMSMVVFFKSMYTEFVSNSSIYAFVLLPRIL